MRGCGLKDSGKRVFPLCCVLSMLFCLHDIARSHLPSRTVVKGTIGTFLLKPQAVTPTHIRADKHLPCMRESSGLRWWWWWYWFTYWWDSEAELDEWVNVFKKLSGLWKHSTVVSKTHTEKLSCIFFFSTTLWFDNSYCPYVCAATFCIFDSHTDCVSLEIGLCRMSQVSLPTDIIEPLSTSVSSRLSSAHAFFAKEKNKQTNICWENSRSYHPKGHLTFIQRWWVRQWEWGCLQFGDFLWWTDPLSNPLRI